MVGVLDGDSMYISSHGEPMDQTGIFELGSVTKPFVAWLTDQALDSLGWTREVSACRFLPDSLCNTKWESVTVEQLLSHRACLLYTSVFIADDVCIVEEYGNIFL